MFNFLCNILQNHLKRKNIYFVFFLFVCFSVYSSNITSNQIRTFIKQAGGPEQFLKRIAKDTAKMSGQMIDDQTQLTGAIVQKKTLVYYIRLVNYESHDIGNIANFRANVASKLSRSVCSAPIASILINEHNAEYKYMVYSKSRSYLFTYSFNRTTCSSTYRW